MTWLFTAEPSKREQLNVHTCFHFLPYLLQPDTFTRSVLMWKKENLFAFMGKAYYFWYSAFAMVNTYVLAQREEKFSNVSFVFLLTDHKPTTSKVISS